jgi:hypothetical protein
MTAFFAEVRGARDRNALLVLAAPVLADRLEELLGEGDAWAREPEGATVLLLVRENLAADEVPRFLEKALGTGTTGFYTRPAESTGNDMKDWEGWVKEWSRSLAVLRQAGRRGFFAAEDRRL